MVFNPLTWGFFLSDRDLSVNYVTAAVAEPG
jgi:2-polyprenyl-6-hydroxyphenyl methylase/3-demethylubiquinone-9 3-methyltransferase